MYYGGFDVPHNFGLTKNRFNSSFWHGRRFECDFFSQNMHNLYINRLKGNFHLSSPPVFSGVRVTRSLVLCVCFVDCCLSFCPFSFGQCFLSVLLRYTDSYYPFCIFKLFSHTKIKRNICWTIHCPVAVFKILAHFDDV